MTARTVIGTPSNHAMKYLPISVAPYYVAAGYLLLT